LISVIVPIYNIKDYIRECIDSIISQTYRKIEIILVDDGSTDGSEKIVDEFEKKDDRIKCIHKHNGGLSSARNAGLDVCTGDYIVFVDGDDFILPNLLEYLLELILSYNADIAIIGSFRDERPEYISDVNAGKSPKVFAGIDYANDLTGDKHFFPHAVWGKMYKRDLVSKIRFPVCSSSKIMSKRAPKR
jgi:glycosyltransferase involved in cell wall biosynthesis